MDALSNAEIVYFVTNPQSKLFPCMHKNLCMHGKSISLCLINDIFRYIILKIKSQEKTEYTLKISHIDE